MNSTRHADSFLELLAYKKSRELARKVFEISAAFPTEERYALTDQMRRASRSIGAQIAEAWGRRRYQKHFISKLTDADSEQYEVRHWAVIAYDSGYLSREVAGDVWKDCGEIGRMLGGMITKAHLFWGETPYQLGETAEEYLIGNSDFDPWQ